MRAAQETIAWSSSSMNLEASYAIYVGKNLTEDGSVLIGGSGDEVSSHWLEIVPGKQYPAGSTIRVGVDETANMPGQFIHNPQVTQTYRYLTMNYSDYEGFPPPITNGGLNENNVAGRDVWSDSRPELVAMIPIPQTGPNYSDLSRIAMERAKSARDAVEIIGELIDEFGYSTYGGNSHMFADENEGWVLLNIAGGQELWIAATGSVIVPFVPYQIGVQSILPEFGKHRYLTKGEATRFVTKDWQIQEATEFAGRTFKRLMYFTCDHPEKFLPEVTEALTAFEDRLIGETELVEKTSDTFYSGGQEQLALRYLTDYTNNTAKSALELGKALLASVEARTRVLYGLRAPETDVISILKSNMVRCN